MYCITVGYLSSSISLHRLQNVTKRKRPRSRDKRTCTFIHILYITSLKLIISQASLSSKPYSTPLDIQDIADQSSVPSPDDAETRRIIRKIDLRLLPTLAVIYAFALIDRVNLPNVRPPPTSIPQLHTTLTNFPGPHRRHGRRPPALHRLALLHPLYDFLHTLHHLPIPRQYRDPETRACGLAADARAVLGNCNDWYGVYA
jgi:hypothetical protein